MMWFGSRVVVRYVGDPKAVERSRPGLLALLLVDEEVLRPWRLMLRLMELLLDRGIVEVPNINGCAFGTVTASVSRFRE